MAISEPKMQIVIANYFKDECDVNTSIRQAFEKGFRIGVKKGASTNGPQEWIPCSERLPEKQTTVLYSLEGCVSVAFMTDRNYTGETVELHWEDLETGITIYPEAWMPLPEPWKGADDEDN